MQLLLLFCVWSPAQVIGYRRTKDTDGLKVLNDAAGKVIVDLSNETVSESGISSDDSNSNPVATKALAAVTTSVKKGAEVIPVPDLRNPGKAALKALAPESTFQSYWKSFIDVMSSVNWVGAIATAAKLAVWGTGAFLVIAFPFPGMGALVNFLISAISKVAQKGTEGLFNIASWTGLCGAGKAAAYQAGKASTKAIVSTLPIIPALMMGYEVIKILTSEWANTDEKTQSDLCNCTEVDVGTALEQIRNQGNKKAEDLLNALPITLDPTLGHCKCSDCDYEIDCNDPTCIPYMFVECKEVCNVVADCYGGNEAAMRLEFPKARFSR